jgi:hypothetical protein
MDEQIGPGFRQLIHSLFLQSEETGTESASEAMIDIETANHQPHDRNHTTRP